MLSLDYLLAVLLLTVSPEPAQLMEAPGTFAVVRLPLRSLAVECEILDPREVRYILARPEDFAADVKLLRRRYQELAQAPGVDDSLRFPERTTVNELLAFNRSYRQLLDMRQPLELVHGWELRMVLQETDRLYQVWDSVRDARCPYYYVTVRRQALKRLRDLIGEDSYYAGNLPPCVPLWRFGEGN
jgi:hypothetical protein